MAKKIIQDIKARSVNIERVPRDASNVKSWPEPEEIIKTSDSKIKEKSKPIKSFYSRPSSIRLSQTPRVKSYKKNPKKFLFILLILSIIISGIYFVSNIFESANVTIVEKHKPVSLNNESFDISGDINMPVHFNIMITSDTEYKDVVLVDPQDVSIKATGEITLYNKYSIKPQKILKGTFVSDQTGKTYQLDSTVTIPGYTTDKSKTIIPGQISVGITSFLAGDTYNGTPVSFSINSFKNTAKATSIYGELKSPLTGGAKGLVYKLSAQDTGILNAEATSDFKNLLLKKVNAQIPEGYILYPNAQSFSYQIDNNILSPTVNAKVKVVDTMSSILIKEKDLSDSIIGKYLPNISPKEFNEIQIPDLDKLIFNFKDQSQTITKDIQSISFTLSGKINLVWNPDIEALKRDLVGAPKSGLQTLLNSDPGIETASVNIFPPWLSYIPTDLSKIHINIK